MAKPELTDLDRARIASSEEMTLEVMAAVRAAHATHGADPQFWKVLATSFACSIKFCEIEYAPGLSEVVARRLSDFPLPKNPFPPSPKRPAPSKPSNRRIR